MVRLWGHRVSFVDLDALAPIVLDLVDASNDLYLVVSLGLPLIDLVLDHYVVVVVLLLPLVDLLVVDLEVVVPVLIPVVVVVVVVAQGHWMMK